jgi:hypothetical protein
MSYSHVITDFQATVTGKEAVVIYGDMLSDSQIPISPDVNVRPDEQCFESLT